MAVQKPMSTVSFRLPRSCVKNLKRTVEYTKWIQSLVLKNLGICPYCSQKIPGIALSEIDQKPDHPKVSAKVKSLAERAANLPDKVVYVPPRRKAKPPEVQTSLIDWLATQVRK